MYYVIHMCLLLMPVGANFAVAVMTTCYDHVTTHTKTSWMQEHAQHKSAVSRGQHTYPRSNYCSQATSCQCNTVVAPEQQLLKHLALQTSCPPDKWCTPTQATTAHKQHLLLQKGLYLDSSSCSSTMH